jgi:hypothetical protein
LDCSITDVVEIKKARTNNRPGLWSMAYSLGGCSCRGAPLRDFMGVSSSG